MSKDESNRMTEAEARTCKDCGHDITRHGKEGCDVELGDSWVEGLYGGALMAQGPCGCSAWEYEEFSQAGEGQTELPDINSRAEHRDAS